MTGPVELPASSNLNCVSFSLHKCSLTVHMCILSAVAKTTSLKVPLSILLVWIQLFLRFLSSLPSNVRHPLLGAPFCSKGCLVSSAFPFSPSLLYDSKRTLFEYFFHIVSVHKRITLLYQKSLKIFLLTKNQETLR